MKFYKIESHFDYQAILILLDALKGKRIESSEAKDFKEEVQKKYAEEIGKAFIEAIANHSGDDVFNDVLEEKI